MMYPYTVGVRGILAEVGGVDTKLRDFLSERNDYQLTNKELLAKLNENILGQIYKTVTIVINRRAFKEQVQGMQCRLKTHDIFLKNRSNPIDSQFFFKHNFIIIIRK